MQVEKILMVDDDACIRKVAEISLTRVGKWQVKMADCGANALNLVPEFKPDVILLDVMMPGMDGITTFRRLREGQSGVFTPVIFMTAKVQKQEIQSYYDLGAAGVIIKPFDPLSLPAQIKSILQGTAAMADRHTACLA